MQDLSQDALVKKRTYAANGMTALFDALRRQKHGLALGLFRVRSNRLSMADIEVMSIKGHQNLAERYSRVHGAPCRVLIADAGIHDRVIMDVDSLAFLLDAAISSNPSHFLRRTRSSKDTDE